MQHKDYLFIFLATVNRQVLIYTDEWTESTWSEWSCSSFNIATIEVEPGFWEYDALTQMSSDNINVIATGSEHSDVLVFF